MSGFFAFRKIKKRPPAIMVNGRTLSEEEALTVCSCVETAAYMFTENADLSKVGMSQEMHDQLQTELVCLRTLFKCR